MSLEKFLFIDHWIALFLVKMESSYTKIPMSNYFLGSFCDLTGIYLQTENYLQHMEK